MAGRALRESGDAIPMRERVRVQLAPSEANPSAGRKSKARVVAKLGKPPVDPLARCVIELANLVKGKPAPCFGQH